MDLRGNPGGLLDAAVEIASYLVPAKSEIVSAKGRNGEEVVYKSVIEPIRPEGMKLAVMVNGGSASASEIVSGVCVCVCVCVLSAKFILIYILTFLVVVFFVHFSSPNL